MTDHTNDITKEQFDIWHSRYRELLASMKFYPPLDRERSMLYLLESMLLRVRLSVGLGDPGTHHPHEEAPDPEGFREGD